MDRWLGRRGHADDRHRRRVVRRGYGVDGEDLGWVDGDVRPRRRLACNPHGIVQAGVHALLLDACMNFAINAALRGRDRTRATLELKTETMRPARRGEPYRLRGEVVRLARQVAYGEASVRDDARVSWSAGRPGRSCSRRPATERRRSVGPCALGPNSLGPAAARAIPPGPGRSGPRSAPRRPPRAGGVPPLRAPAAGRHRHRRARRARPEPARPEVVAARHRRLVAA